MGPLTMMRMGPLVLVAAIATGCPKAPTSTADLPASGQVRIPEGCDVPQGGEWVHARDSAFRYVAEDDGVTLVLRAQRVAAPTTDAPPADPGTGDDDDVAGDELAEEEKREEAIVSGTPADSELAPIITLTRGPEGFTGATVAHQYLPDGTACDVPYPTVITSCTDGALTLSTALYASLDASCEAAPTQGEAPHEEHRLVRPGSQRGQRGR